MVWQAGRTGDGDIDEKRLFFSCEMLKQWLFQNVFENAMRFFKMCLKTEHYFKLF